ncbi:MAG TPA: geranylgeranylglyceryl/heptaprenylglyceryl phosphate synthase, partial [Puia sp.]|nr:geranylgeranylglyceryl/heptaprenylglyceryl phosphate synthase [Puia sp.]
MKDEIYSAILLKKKIRRKSFALLIDPDKVDQTKLPALVELAEQARVDYLFVGGSLVVTNHLDQVVLQIKSLCKIPIILFPGTPSQVSAHADALLYLSLISGRNPELLIGQHVISAPAVRKSRLEIISTGYMVIDGGAPT